MKIMISCLFLLIGCTKTDATFSKEQMYAKGKAADSSFELVIPSGISTSLVNCGQYIPKCESGYKVQVKLLKFNALMYNTKEDAMKSAISMDGYYSGNWAFDYVKGEPILERFVTKVFKAKKVSSQEANLK